MKKIFRYSRINYLVLRLNALEPIRKEYNLWRYNAEQGFHIDFIDIENLKKNKKAAGRPQDLADAVNLE